MKRFLFCSWASSLGLLVHCLLVLFLLRTVLLALLAEHLLVGCLRLDRLLVWFLLNLGFAEDVVVEGVYWKVHWVSGSGPGRKKFD